MIDNHNLDPSGTAFRQVVLIQQAAIGASLADVEHNSFRAPYAGKIVSIHAYAVAITDADDGARLDVKKATTSVLSATINPTAVTQVAGTLKTDGTATFAAGDKIGLFVTTGAGDAITNLSVTIVIRPLLGEETTRPSA